MWPQLPVLAHLALSPSQCPGLSGLHVHFLTEAYDLRHSPTRSWTLNRQCATAHQLGMENPKTAMIILIRIGFTGKDFFE